MLALAPSFDGKRTIPSPQITEIMLELLNLKPSDRVMEIGTGSGYQTQQLAKTGAEIHSVEIEPWIDSSQIIGECVFLHSGDGIAGLPSVAPFTAIVASCGVEQVPKAWKEQLTDKGRLVAPVGSPEVQRLTLFYKHKSELIPARIGAYCRFQMMKEPPRPGKIPYQAKNAQS